MPQQVLADCLVRPEQADTQRVMVSQNAGWIQISVTLAIAEPAELGIGERAAIGRALKIGIGLLAAAGVPPP